MPESWNVLMEAFSDSVKHVAAGEAYVLVGYSIGGVLAHALAHRLEQEAEGPAGVIAIDSYLPRDALETSASTVVEHLMAREVTSIDDTSLIALGAYTRIFGEWQPTPIAAPLLEVRAGERLLVDGVQLDERLPSLQPPQREEITADHYSIIAEDVGAAAHRVETWLGRTVDPWCSRE